MIIKYHKQNGFTLIEMAVVLAIIGLMATLFFKMVPPFILSMRYLGTETRENNVEEALALYVAQNYRLPCPADPSLALGAPGQGYEDGSGADGATPPAVGGCPRTEGVIPYHTLGLSKLDAVDGWGHFITYAISADFGKPIWGAATLNSVHEMCRSQDWLAEQSGLTARTGAAPDSALYGAFDRPGSVAGTTPFNKNPWKAKFCCMAPGGGADLVITDQNGWDVMLPEAAWQLDNAAVAWHYATNNNSYRAAGSNGYANVTTMVFAGTRYDPLSLDNPKYRIDDPFPDTSMPLGDADLPTAPAAANALTTGHDADATDYRGRATDSNGNAIVPAVPMSTFRGWNVSPIYILVSHGQNGAGAYRVDGTGGRFASAPAGSPDDENSDGDNVFAYRYIHSDVPALTYDDQITWGTQETLLSLVGQTCATP